MRKFTGVAETTTIIKILPFVLGQEKYASKLDDHNARSSTACCASPLEIGIETEDNEVKRTRAKRLPKRHRVVTLVYDRVSIFELGTVLELFGRDRKHLVPDWYDFRICSLGENHMTSFGDLQLEAPHSVKILDSADTIIIPGWRDFDEMPPENLLRKIRRAHQRSARIVSICTGAFVLAAAGILDGRRVTTHWMYAEELAARYPKIHVDPNVLYLDAGNNVYTSAGSAAGIDMGLHLIRMDFGAKAANFVARRMVVAPCRDGGQAQFIRDSVPRPATDEQVFSKLLDWLRQNLEKDHSVSAMARRTNMSDRTFARRFKIATGTTPQKWLCRQRVLAAQELLETTDQGLEWVALKVGLGSAQLLRIHFHNQIGVTPSVYRKSFHRQLD